MSAASDRSSGDSAPQTTPHRIPRDYLVEQRDWYAALYEERRKSPELCDVVLCSSDDRIVVAHRAVLCTPSSGAGGSGSESGGGGGGGGCGDFFRKMLAASHFVEGRDSVCHLRTIDGDCLELLVDYMYGREVAADIDDAHLLPMFAASHLLSLRWLNAYCAAGIERRPLETALNHPQLVERCRAGDSSLIYLLLELDLLLDDVAALAAVVGRWPSDEPKLAEFALHLVQRCCARPRDEAVICERNLGCILGFTGSHCYDWCHGETVTGDVTGDGNDYRPVAGVCQAWPNVEVWSDRVKGATQRQQPPPYPTPPAKAQHVAFTSDGTYYATTSEISMAVRRGGRTVVRPIYVEPSDQILVWPPLLRLYGSSSVVWTEQNRRTLVVRSCRRRSSPSSQGPRDQLKPSLPKGSLVRHIASTDTRDYGHVTVVVTLGGDWKVMRASFESDNVPNSNDRPKFVDLECPLKAIECATVLRDILYVLGNPAANGTPAKLLRYHSGGSDGGTWVTLSERLCDAIPRAFFPLNDRIYVLANHRPAHEVYEPSLDAWIIEPSSEFVDLGGFAVIQA